MARPTQSFVLDPTGLPVEISQLSVLFSASKSLTNVEKTAWAILFGLEGKPITRKALLESMLERLKPSGKKVTVSWIPNVFLKNLDSLGLTNYDGNFVFITGDLSKILISKLAATEKKPNKAILKSRLLESESLLPEAPGYAYLDGIFHQVIPNAIRPNTYDKRKTISVNVSYPVRNAQQKLIHETLRITSSCRSTERSKIATLDDMPYTIMLDSMFVAYVKEKASHLIESRASLDEIAALVGNRFSFDIYDLCRAMDITKRNAEVVYERLLRLADSEFEIDYSDAPFFLDRVKLDSFDLERYRYFTEIKVKTELHQNDNVENLVERKPRIIEVVFHSSKFKMLIEQGVKYRRYSIPIELAKERDGLILKIIIFLRQNLGTTPNARSIHKRNKWLLHELKQKCAPNYEDIRNFEKDFYRVIQRYLITGTQFDSEGMNVAIVHGYRIELDFNEERVTHFTDWFVKTQKERKPRRLYPIVSASVVDTTALPSPELILRVFEISSYGDEELAQAIFGLPTQFRTTLRTIGAPSDTIEYFETTFFKNQGDELKVVYREDLIRGLVEDREVSALAVDFCLKAIGMSATKEDIAGYCLAVKYGRQSLSAKSIIGYFEPRQKR